MFSKGFLVKIHSNTVFSHDFVYVVVLCSRFIYLSFFLGEKSSSKLPYKPLANKKFYLDIKSNKGKVSITADIHNLGGVS